MACMPPGGEPTGTPSGTGGAPAVATGGSGAAPSSSGGSPGAVASGGSTGSPNGAGGSAPSGSGGSSATGSGGSGPSIDPERVDAQAPAPDAAASGSGGSGGSAPPSAPPTAPGTPDPESAFTCTHLIGINATAEWYGAGFEQIIDGNKWQLVRVHSGFVDIWANPGASVWNTGPTSACATNSKTPDRVIFIGLRFEWTSKQQWVDALTNVVKNLKMKFPGLKRIELGTFVRGPGNKPCGSRPAYRSTIHPSQDEAIAEVVATDPMLLKASPKFEVTACSDFTGNPPHFAGNGAKNVAKVVGDYYAGRK